jgi:MFS family permease
LAGVSLCNDVASEMIYPLLPPFVAGLGGGPAILGLIDGASDFAAATLRWWSGRAADRSGTRGPLLGGGYLLANLVRPVLALATAAWQVVAIRVVDRIGKGLRSPARDALIADLTPSPLLGKAFGLHRSADHLGAVLGSLLAFELLRRGWPIREIFAASLAPGAAALLLLAVALRLARRGGPAAAGEERSRSRTSDPPAAGLVWLAALAAVRFPEALLLFRLQELGAPIPSLPLVWAVLHVVRSLASYPSGLVADRLGSRPALLLGALLHGLALIGLGVTGSPALALALFLGNGVVLGITEPAERAAIARLAPDKRGSAFGRYQALAGLGALAAGVAFGWGYQALGPLAILAIAAALGLGVAAVGRREWGRKV